MKLEELKDVLIDDCRDLGVPQERMDRVFSIIRVEKITAGGNDVFSFYRDENGYFLVYWEKGHPVGGITATNPDDFRFAF